MAFLSMITLVLNLSLHKAAHLPLWCVFTSNLMCENHLQLRKPSEFRSGLIRVSVTIISCRTALLEIPGYHPLQARRPELHLMLICICVAPCRSGVPQLCLTLVWICVAPCRLGGQKTTSNAWSFALHTLNMMKAP